MKRGVYRRRHRSDENQSEIVEYLRKAGASVAIIGEPVDLAVGYQGVTCLIEIKTAKGDLNPEQAEFFKIWKGSAVVLRNVYDAQALLRTMSTGRTVSRMVVPETV